MKIKFNKELTKSTGRFYYRNQLIQDGINEVEDDWGDDVSFQIRVKSGIFEVLGDSKETKPKRASRNKRKAASRVEATESKDSSPKKDSSSETTPVSE